MQTNCLLTICFVYDLLQDIIVGILTNIPSHCDTLSLQMLMLSICLADASDLEGMYKLKRSES